MAGIKTTPEEYAEKWATKLAAATEDIRRGVEKVSVAPGELAAKSEAKMLAGIREAIESGRWAAAVGKVTLADWKKAMLEKGIGRIRAGTTAAKGEMATFARDLFAKIESEQGKLSGMPSLTLEDNIARMVQFIRGMSEYHYKG